jgi:hypothetical protein
MASTGTCVEVCSTTRYKLLTILFKGKLLSALIRGIILTV